MVLFLTNSILTIFGICAALIAIVIEHYQFVGIKNKFYTKQTESPTDPSLFKKILVKLNIAFLFGIPAGITISIIFSVALLVFGIEDLFHSTSIHSFSQFLYIFALHAKNIIFLTTGVLFGILLIVKWKILERFSIVSFYSDMAHNSITHVYAILVSIAVIIIISFFGFDDMMNIFLFGLDGELFKEHIQKKMNEVYVESSNKEFLNYASEYLDYVDYDKLIENKINSSYGHDIFKEKDIQRLGELENKFEEFIENNPHISYMWISPPHPDCAYIYYTYIKQLDSGVNATDTAWCKEMKSRQETLTKTIYATGPGLFTNVLVIAISDENSLLSDPYKGYIGIGISWNNIIEKYLEEQDNFKDTPFDVEKRLSKHILVVDNSNQISVDCNPRCDVLGEYLSQKRLDVAHKKLNVTDIEPLRFVFAEYSTGKSMVNEITFQNINGTDTGSHILDEWKIYIIESIK